MSDLSPVEAIFFAALEKKNFADRNAYLDEVCSGQPALRAGVEKLLAAHSRVGGFLEAGAGLARTEPFERTSVSDPLENAVVAGRYKLLQQIGEGGMGSVWMADQTEPVRRRVALKLIRVDRSNTKMILSRFEAERQAIALMDHPHIARLLDAGTTDEGQPYFVMELVKGIALTDYCDAHKLGIPERLVLFQQVCSAVQHAHQKGIIHRDLKPSNILVESHDGQAVPKVIDFGLAKAASGMQLSDHTLFTAFGTVMGTPTYMAPEQATFNAVDVDTRADVYSLGVILYELLTGTTPISRETVKKAAMDEVLKIVREQDAPKPSSRLGSSTTTNIAANRNLDPARLSKLVRGDLDWIVLKALEKDRKRRYETANSLAADIQRHLVNEPVVARPPSAAYRLQKAWLRNKLACTAGAAIAAAIFIGLAVSIWQAVRADQEANRAKAAEQKAVTALQELSATAPAFAEQARTLAETEQFDKALEKLNYAISLRPDAAEYLMAKGDLLQCQLQLAKAAQAYRQALQVQPELARAAIAVQLCEDLLAAPPNADGTLTRESLAVLHLAMQREQRPLAELMPIARRLGEEKQYLVQHWLARLQDLPVTVEIPLKKRLTILEDGRLALNLADTKVVDLSPLSGAPLATLDLSRCRELREIAPLRGMQLISLNISGTKVADLSPLREMQSLQILNLDETQVTDLVNLSKLRLKHLNLANCAVRDLAPLRKMPLEALDLTKTGVADLSPLIGLPIRNISLGSTPVVDFSPLAQLPLEKCYLQSSRIVDLRVLRGRPLKELILWGCEDARHYVAIAEIKTLEMLLLPSQYRTLPEEEIAAIRLLREHPRLRQLGANVMNQMTTAGITTKEVFWREWDREQGFVAALRAEGIQFTLHQLPQGTYHLKLYHQPISDLLALKDAPISRLEVIQCAVQDISPLTSLPLDELSISSDALVDLSPLRGLQLKKLSLNCSRINDLKPLVGLPLKRLTLSNLTKLTDVSPVAEITTLEDLVVPMQASNIKSLRALPKLRRMGFQAKPAGDPAATVEQFWLDYDRFAKLWDAGFLPETLLRLDDGTWNVDVGNTMFSDLSLFGDAPISALRVDHTLVTDLAPLRGMPIRNLQIAGTNITDLAPLRGMPLTDLRATGAKIINLAPLRDLPLTHLRLDGCPDLTDLSPLADCQTLQSITLPPQASSFEFLRKLPKLQRIGYAWDNNGPDKSTAQFWKEYDELGWLRKLQASGLVKSALRLPDGTWDLDFTNSKLSDLSPLQGQPVSRLVLHKTAVADLSPLRGMPLKYLNLWGTPVSDLSPLQDLPLENLILTQTQISDLTPLRGIPLATLHLHACAQLADVSPLAECKELRDLTLPGNAKNVAALRKLSKLARIGFAADVTIGYRPDQSAAQFWRNFDSKQPTEPSRTP